MATLISVINTTAKANKPTMFPFAREVPLILLYDEVSGKTEIFPFLRHPLLASVV